MAARFLLSRVLVCVILTAAVPAGADQQTPGSPTPIGLTTLGSAYTQNFDTLANSETLHNLIALPGGWVLFETGASADGAYRGGNGATNNGTTGDVYSYGTSGATERAFGTLFSGSLTPTIGAVFTNNTGSTVSSLAIAYRGEEWRLGATGRGSDRLDFQYSLDATSLSTGTWTDVDALDFSTPNVSAAVGAIDGNASGNFTNTAHTISSLSIASVASFWIRWSEFNVTNSDDGLAVDDFSLTAQGAAASNVTWNGNAGDGKWSTAGNWNAPPSNGSNLTFAGTSKSPIPTNDSFLTSVGGITFDSTATDFTLNGSGTTTGVSISGGITNNSSKMQTVNLGLTLTAPQQFNAASEDLSVTGAVATGTSTLTLTGPKNISITGAISGNGSLIKSGLGTATLSGTNSYSGTTTVSAGMLVVGDVHALGTGGLSIGAAALIELQAGLTAPVQLTSLTIAGGAAILDVTGTVDNTTDYELWSSGFAHQGGPLAGGSGSAADALSAIQPVPEPSALALSFLAGSGLGVAILRRKM